jgi:short-subunit dehydrogenase
MIFKGKKVLITGASSGIGEALAFAFNRTGAEVVLVARNEKELHRVQTKLNQNFSSWVYIYDISKYEQADVFALKIINEVGPIDILVNNAGLSQRSLVYETSFADELKLIEVNLIGLIALTKAFMPTIIKQKGQIVAISSVMGKINTKYRSAYAAAKHGVVGYFDSIRLELAEYQVNVCNIMPGFVATNIAKNAVGSNEHIIANSENDCGMKPEVFAKKAIEAIYKKKSNVIIGGFKEKFAVKIKNYFPSLFDLFIKNKKVI